TIYQCATGQPAFAGPTLTAIMRAVTTHHPPPPHQVNPAVPELLSNLIMRLLAKSPSARPPSAQDVLHDLTDLDGQADTTDWRPRLPRPGRRRWVILIAAAAVVLVVAVGAWLVTPPPGQRVVPGPPTDPSTPVRYRGQVNVLVERRDREGKVRLLRLN